jgi:hypothetical protein
MSSIILIPWFSFVNPSEQSFSVLGNYTIINSGSSTAAGTLSAGGLR